MKNYKLNYKMSSSQNLKKCSSEKLKNISWKILWKTVMEPLTISKSWRTQKSTKFSYFFVNSVKCKGKSRVTDNQRQPSCIGPRKGFNNYGIFWRLKLIVRNFKVCSPKWGDWQENETIIRETHSEKSMYVLMKK